MQHVDSEVWDKEYKDIFFGDPKQHEMRQQAQARMAPAQAGQQGSLNIKPVEKKITEGDLSQFFGRAGGAGKADPNKAVARERAKRAPLTIGPDTEGNLSVSTDGDEG